MKISRFNLFCVGLAVILILAVGFSLLPDKVTVAHVEDGDTFKTESNEWIRFARIDAPETDTSEGRNAQKYVKQMLLNTEVEIKDCFEGYYGRQVCEVILSNGTNLSNHLLEKGFAVPYKP